MVDLAGLLADLDAESRSLDAIVAALPEHDWQRPTPAPGWTISHQIAHLTWTDEVSIRAATDPEGFTEALAEAAGDVYGFVDRAALKLLAPPAAMLERWRSGRRTLAAALAAAPPGTRLPWFATAMSPASMATARMMETFAHGVDVRDALRLPVEATTRLRHVAYLGVRTLGYSFAVHDLPVPDAPVRVELAAPEGDGSGSWCGGRRTEPESPETWTYGPADAADRVTGPALDFCLLVTQRRHRADLALAATGPVADRWLDVAQAFAGPPGAGREPATPAADAGVPPEPPAADRGDT